ncbi:MAG: hypothetical protein HOV94_40850 [Saccharothrix sp.]|nr:hypothetical protein [Saccharothrix sp.]
MAELEEVVVQCGGCANEVASGSVGGVVQSGGLVGTAHASGGYANTGIHIGDVHVALPVVARGCHLERNARLLDVRLDVELSGSGVAVGVHLRTGRQWAWFKRRGVRVFSWSALLAGRGTRGWW